MRILVCGGRDFLDEDYVWNAMLAFEMILDTRITTVIHGDAKGADKAGGYWAEKHGREIEAYPAQWDKYGKSAGYKRNAQMLEEGKPDAVLAFKGGKGTAMMVSLATKAGVAILDTALFQRN